MNCEVPENPNVLIIIASVKVIRETHIICKTRKFRMCCFRFEKHNKLSITLFDNDLEVVCVLLLMYPSNIPKDQVHVHKCGLRPLAWP